MKLNFKGIFTARYWTFLMSALLLAMVAACGGGNGSAGTPLGGSGSGTSGSGTGSGGVSSANGTISVSLATSSGTAATVIPAGSYLVATANVKNGSGSVAANVLVTFTVSNAAATMSPALGTAVTDSQGNAKITLQPGTVSGAGYIIATATVVGTTSISSSQVAYSSTTAGTSGTPTLKLSFAANNCAANTVSSSCPLVANATVTDSTGAPVPNTLVTFSVPAVGSVTLTNLTPSTGSTLTNSAGVAAITINPATLQTAVQQAGSSGIISASATVGGVTTTAQQYYTMGNTSINLALITPATGSANVNAYGTTTISLSVNSNGSLYTAQPVTVNFSSGCQQLANPKATLPSTASSVNGIVAVTYTDLGCGQSDTVTATVAGAASPVTVTLKVAAPIAASINFISANPSNNSIVLPNSGGNGRTSTALLTYKVVDTNGNPLSGQTVNFTNNAPTIATLNTTTAQSQTDGTVTASVTSGSVGTFRITATLAGSNPVISAISDSVVVSTGNPVSAAMDLAATVLNISGWDGFIDSTVITAYLSDANGNAVAAGTPVSFTSPAGQLANSAIGGCLTDLTGACSITYRATNPLPVAPANASRTGVATVTASSTNGTDTPITYPIDIVFSGNEPYLYYYTGGSWQVSTGGSIIVQPTTCSANTEFVLADVNGNVLPYQSTITATTVTTGLTLGTLIPATVPNGKGTKSITSGTALIIGTDLTVPVTSPIGACTPVSAGGTLGHGGALSYNLTIASPKGSAALFAITIQYPG